MQWLTAATMAVAMIGLPATARAEVLSAGPNGFEIQHSVSTVAPPQATFEAFGRIAEWWNADLDSAGIDPGSVDTAVVGTSGPLIAKTLDDGKIQAYVGNASDFTALSANDVALRNITPEDVAQIDGNPMATLPGTLEEKREAIVGFLRAWAKGQYVGQINREVVEQIARDKVPAEWRNEASGEAALDLAITLMKPDDPERIGDLRPDVWATGQDVLVRAGVIEEGDTIDVNEALDDSLIEEINDWDRAEVEAAVEEYANGG